MRHILSASLCSICFMSVFVANANAAPVTPQLDVANKQMGAAMQMVDSAPRPLPVARDGEVIDSVGGGATEAVLPVVEKNDGISYITGGIGDEEMAEMQAQEPNFNVRILISSVGGEYMGENTIRFLNQKNVEILRVKDVGPFFYANLPAGTYMAEVASPKGVVQRAKVVAREKAPATGKIVIRFNE